MPDMPMPPMPTKWMIPISVPKAFIIEGVLSNDSPSSCRHTIHRSRPDARSEDRADRDRGQSAADAFDEVGEIARGVRAPDRQGARRGIVERDRVGGHCLDLAGQDRGREIGLLDSARAASLG